jgi:tetratricopeptide (TPR) repeat protein
MWSRFPTERLMPGFAAALLAACGTAPVAPGSSGGASPPAPASQAPASGSAESEPADDLEDLPAAGSAMPEPVAVPERAAAQFSRAVELMRGGQAGEAELEFKQLAAGYPQLSGPHVNLGILYRKAGKLDPAVDSLRLAVQRNPASAVAWTELGVTLRMQGRFKDAAAAYERAIAADAAHAPAHRNLGVLRDLYLGDANGALDSLERYKALITAEDKQLNGWIAELRQRTGRPAQAPAPAAAPPPAAAPEDAPAEPQTPENPEPARGEGVVP